MTRSDVFRAGDVLDGYRLLEDFRVVGAGRDLGTDEVLVARTGALHPGQRCAGRADRGV
jgi:hypothetical protein